MNKEEIYRLTDLYLDGGMTSEERASFEANCKSDPAFKEAFMVQTQARLAASQSAETALKTQLASQFDDLKASFQDQQRRGASLNRWWLAAAAVIILLITIPFVINNQGPQSMEEIYQGYADFPLPPVNRSNSDDGKKWQEAIAPYYAGNFSQAIQSLNDFLQTPEGQKIAPRVHFFMGLSYLQSEQSQEALEAFGKVDRESIYHSYVLWYQAIIQLKEGDKEQAISQLEAILEFPNHFKREEATEILGLIK